MNIASITRIAETKTTGSTGNIATGFANTGLQFVVAPCVAGNAVFLRAWVSSADNGWYLTAINPNTGATVNNTSLAIRYLLVQIKAM